MFANERSSTSPLITNISVWDSMNLSASSENPQVSLREKKLSPKRLEEKKEKLLNIWYICESKYKININQNK